MRKYDDTSATVKISGLVQLSSFCFIFLLCWESLGSNVAPIQTTPLLLRPAWKLESIRAGCGLVLPASGGLKSSFG